MVRKRRKTRFGPIITVALAFFMAEMGDKTQLATVALATKFPGSPLGVLLGTTMGMIIADGIGIIVGVVLCKKIPERIVKLVSAGVFIVFGFIGCYEVATGKLNLSTPGVILAMAVLAVITGISAYLLIKKNKAREAQAVPPVCLKDIEVSGADDDHRQTEEIG